MYNDTNQHADPRPVKGREKRRKKMKNLENHELASKIKAAGEWDADLLKELCFRAGMAEEWEEADDMTFEKVALRAADKLGVDIL
jgi:hypothetical protein